MHPYAFGFLGILSIGSIAAQVPEPKPAPATPEIFLVGSVHNMHFEERFHYSLVDLQAQVDALRPDVVCGEITPEAFNGPMEGNFPPEAAMLAEMAAQHGYRFVPADWRESLSKQNGATERVPKKQAESIDDAELWEQAWFDVFSGASLYDETTDSPRFQAMEDHKFEQLIGTNTVADVAAGAWHERNRRIVRNCLLEAGPVRRIVFVFGVAHLPQLERQLAARGLTAKRPARSFTPAGLGQMPEAVMVRWERNLLALEDVAAGRVPATRDMRARVKQTNRAPVLRGEIEIYRRRETAK
jgi:hypothetical protein